MIGPKFEDTSMYFFLEMVSISAEYYESCDGVVIPCPWLDSESQVSAEKKKKEIE